jgi:lipoyl(octanoyl) transferase
MGHIGILEAARAEAPLRGDGSPVEWTRLEGLSAYEATVAAMEARAGAIARGEVGECVWLVEHPPLYTAGTSARDSELLEARFPVHVTGRGGRFTYHGPGQRIAYVMLDLRRRGPDVRAFVTALETWIIACLASFGVVGATRRDRVGVWVERCDKPPRPDGTPAEDKIAAIGIRLKRWVSFHGVAINVAPDLSHFSGIVPCGVADAGFGVTSLADLGVRATMVDVDAALREAFGQTFGPTRDGKA